MDMKKEYLKEIDSKMNYVNAVKDNLDTIRSEPLNLATLLADKELIKADDIDKAVANISLHSFKSVHPFLSFTKSVKEILIIKLN